MFGTSGIRGSLEEVSPSLCLRLGKAVGSLSSRVVVGRDGRLTGKSLKNSLVAGLESVGAEVVDVGVVPTHTLAWAAREHGCLGVMVTASHNPPSDNGLKVFGSDGSEISRETERRLEERVGDSDVAEPRDWTESDERGCLSAYLRDALDYVGEDGDVDLRVAVDCANGVGSLTTLPLLREMGCEVTGVNAQIDGSFPGREPKPTPDSLSEFGDFVRDGDFDLGLAHDGDADRLVVVDGDGDVVPEDAVVAVLADDYTNRDGGTVVTTPNASSKIDQRVDGEVRRTRLGGLSEALDDDVVFAAEPWKHVFPKFGGWIDGTVSAAEVVRLVAEAGSTEDLFGDIRISVEKTNVDCPDDAKRQAIEGVEERTREEFGSEAEIDTSYGVRLDFGGGDWALVRPSGTEPVVRVYSEGFELERVVEVVEEAIREAQ
ncbi:phosphomannomutase [Halorutilales archaeon Cl-col2-1]